MVKRNKQRNVVELLPHLYFYAGGEGINWQHLFIASPNSVFLQDQQEIILLLKEVKYESTKEITKRALL